MYHFTSRSPDQIHHDDQIDALLDTIECDDEEDENLMNDSDNKFIDESLTENGGSKRALSLSTSCLHIENY